AGGGIHRKGGVLAVLVDAGSGAILADPDAPVRIGRMIIVSPRGDAIQRTRIPAEIFIERDELSVKGRRIIITGVRRRGRSTRRVLLRNQLDFLVDEIGRYRA